MSIIEVDELSVHTAVQLAPPTSPAVAAVCFMDEKQLIHRAQDLHRRMEQLDAALSGCRDLRRQIELVDDALSLCHEAGQFIDSDELDAATRSRPDFSTHEERLAIRAAREGRPEGILAHLRSKLPKSTDFNRFLADYLAGQYKRQRGRPPKSFSSRITAIDSAALDASLLEDLYRERGFSHRVPGLNGRMVSLHEECARRIVEFRRLPAVWTPAIAAILRKGRLRTAASPIVRPALLALRGHHRLVKDVIGYLSNEKLPN